MKDASTVLTKLIDGNAVDEDGYGSFNTARSTYRGEFVWNSTMAQLMNSTFLLEIEELYLNEISTGKLKKEINVF